MYFIFPYAYERASLYLTGYTEWRMIKPSTTIALLIVVALIAIGVGMAAKQGLTKQTSNTQNMVEIKGEISQ